MKKKILGLTLAAVITIPLMTNTYADSLYKKGSSGDEVQKIQQALKKLNLFNEECTGYFGDVTVNSIKAFQSKYELTPDGIVGADTKTILFAASNALDSSNGPVLKKGDKSNDVKSAQEKLNKLGFFNEECTGYFGEVTKDAVIAFQKRYKLVEDGKLGPNTLGFIDRLISSQGIKVSSRSLSARDKVYTIQPGDCISIIADELGVSIKALLKANNLTEKSVLQIGQKLIIPTNNTTTPKVSEQKPQEIKNDTNKTPSENISEENTQNSEVPDELLDDQTGQVEQNEEVSDTQEEPQKEETSEKGVEYINWFSNVEKIFAKGDIATVTDVDTGKTFKVKRLYGGQHADCEPLTKEDTSTMKSIYGGSWSWDRRAIIVEIDDHKIAASMNGMPHGGQSIKTNNFRGHFCIHFKGSTTHKDRTKPDAKHQTMVKKAAGIK